jgi:hypothetical protein
VTRCVCQRNGPKCSPTRFFVKIKTYILHKGGNLGYSVIFQKPAQNKQSPQVRKFVQSGHPGFDIHIRTGSGQKTSGSGCKLWARAGLGLLLNKPEPTGRPQNPGPFGLGPEPDPGLVHTRLEKHLVAYIDHQNNLCTYTNGLRIGMYKDI